MSTQVTAAPGLDARFNSPPWRLSGVVVGAALNDPAQLAALGDAVAQPPYKAAPRAPVLYVKPRNTLRASGATVDLPPGADGVEVAATLGLVIGRACSRVAEAQALARVAAWVLVADLSLPHANYYRPNARLKAFDASCLVGTPVAVGAADPAGLVLQLAIDGGAPQPVPLADLQRPAARLVADVSEFMTLNPGDVLLLGRREPAPVLRAGQSFSLTAEGLGVLQGRMSAGEAAA